MLCSHSSQHPYLIWKLHFATYGCMCNTTYGYMCIILYGIGSPIQFLIRELTDHMVARPGYHKRGLTNLKEELRLTNQSFAQLLQVFEHDNNYDTLQLCGPHQFCFIMNKINQNIIIVIQSFWFI